MPDAPPATSSGPLPHTRRWRTAALVILVLGILSAGLDYWLVSRSQSQSGLDDLSQSSADKKALHQMSVIYGKSGYLIDDLENAVARPGVQAALILGIAGLLAAGCWYISRLPAPEPLDDFFKSSDKKQDG